MCAWEIGIGIGVGIGVWGRFVRDFRCGCVHVEVVGVGGGGLHLLMMYVLHLFTCIMLYWIERGDVWCVCLM